MHVRRTGKRAAVPAAATQQGLLGRVASLQRHDDWGLAPRLAGIRTVMWRKYTVHTVYSRLVM
jgi:hypothetical protein